MLFSVNQQFRLKLLAKDTTKEEDEASQAFDGEDEWGWKEEGKT
jgi:hypothetical protein